MSIFCSNSQTQHLDKLSIKNNSYKTSNPPGVPESGVRDEWCMMLSFGQRWWWGKKIRYQIKGTSCPRIAFHPLRTPVLRSTSAGTFPGRQKTFFFFLFADYLQLMFLFLSALCPYEWCQDGASYPGTEPALHCSVVGYQLQPHALQITDMFSAGRK